VTRTLIGGMTVRTDRHECVWRGRCACIAPPTLGPLQGRGVVHDRVSSEPERLIEPPGGSVERVATGADVHHRDTTGSQPLQNLAAQCGTHATTLGDRMDGDHLQSPGSSLGDAPSDVAQDLFVLLREGDDWTAWVCDYTSDAVFDGGGERAVVGRDSLLAMAASMPPLTR
jgi:hypothetical protein